MRFQDGKRRRVGPSVRVRAIWRIVVLTLMGAMVLMPTPSWAGTVPIAKPSVQGTVDMKLYPFLACPDRGRYEVAAVNAGAGAGENAAAALMRHGFGNDPSFDGSAAPQSDPPSSPRATSYFIAPTARAKGPGGAPFVARPAAESASESPDQRASSQDEEGASANAGRLSAGGAASVPLPAAVFLTPPGLALAGYAARRLGRTR